MWLAVKSCAVRLLLFVRLSPQESGNSVSSPTEIDVPRIYATATHGIYRPDDTKQAIAMITAGPKFPHQVLDKRQDTSGSNIGYHADGSTYALAYCITASFSLSNGFARCCSVSTCVFRTACVGNTVVFADGTSVACTGVSTCITNTWFPSSGAATSAIYPECATEAATYFSISPAGRPVVTSTSSSSRTSTTSKSTQSSSTVTITGTSTQLITSGGTTSTSLVVFTSTTVGIDIAAQSPGPNNGNNNNNNKSSSSSDKGKIIGGSVGGALGGAILALAGIFLCATLRKRGKNRPVSTPFGGATPPAMMSNAYAYPAEPVSQVYSPVPTEYKPPGQPGGFGTPSPPLGGYQQPMYQPQPQPQQPMMQPQYQAYNQAYGMQGQPVYQPQRAAELASPARPPAELG